MTERDPSTPATVFIATVILVVFGAEMYTGAWRNGNLLPGMGSIVPVLVFQKGEYWRLLTAMFLHGGVVHLVFNLIALWQLGRLYEMLFGTKRFVLVYFVTGIIASIASLLHMHPYSSSVGASGAVFGILGALIFSIRRSPRFRHERWARGVVQQLVFWIVVNIVIGFTIPQIDMAAHIGGLIAGLVLGATLPQKQPPIPPSEAVIDVRALD